MTTAKTSPKSKTHSEMLAEWMTDPEFCAEFDKLEDEFSLLDELLAARHSANLTQAQVAERMGTKAPAITRLESGLASGMKLPSVSTLQRYANACGKKLRIKLV